MVAWKAVERVWWIDYASIKTVDNDNGVPNHVALGVLSYGVLGPHIPLIYHLLLTFHIGMTILFLILPFNGRHRLRKCIL
jgi:hypothetical protein